MRLFFALELPPEIQAALGRLQSKQDDRDYRWVDPALMHLTLAFLGNRPEEQLPLLEQIGGRSARASRPGMLRLGEAGSFGTRRAPRVLWVDLAGDLEALLGLQSRLADELRQAGLPIEERPFSPHITLARRRETAQGGAPSGWPPTLPLRRATFPLGELTLMQSRLSPRGPTYTPVAKFPVGATA